MIRIDFLTLPSGGLLGFSMEGHAGYGEEGEDIVCAAVSSAAYLTVNTITEFLHVAPLALRVEEGELFFRIEQKDEHPSGPDVPRIPHRIRTKAHNQGKLPAGFLPQPAEFSASLCEAARRSAHPADWFCRSRPDRSDRMIPAIRTHRLKFPKTPHRSKRAVPAPTGPAGCPCHSTATIEYAEWLPPQRTPFPCSSTDDPADRPFPPFRFPKRRNENAVHPRRGRRRFLIPGSSPAYLLISLSFSNN